MYMKKFLIFACCALLGIACGGNEKKSDDAATTVKIAVDLQNCDAFREGDIFEVVSEEKSEPIATITLDQNKSFEVAAELIYGEVVTININELPEVIILQEQKDVKVSYDNEKGVWNIDGTSLNEKFDAYTENGNNLVMELYGSLTDEEAEERYAALLTYLEQAVAANSDNHIALFALNAYASMGGDSDKSAELFGGLDKRLSGLKAYKSIQTTMPGADIIDLQLPTADGTVVSVAQLCREGKWVLIDFWATWCGPCRGEIPYLVAAYEKFAPKGLEIYGVSFDRNGDEQKWQDFTKENSMSWVNVWGTGEDGTWAAGEAYGVQGIPSNFLYSPEGKLVAKNLRGEDVEKILAEHIK
jgi:thiol-disulfide isomerase/thioredoxin